MRTRSALIPRILADLGPGEMFNVDEIADALTRRGHDFDNAATDQAGRAHLTRLTLNRLARRGVVVQEDDRLGTPCWRSPTVQPDDPTDPDPTDEADDTAAPTRTEPEQSRDDRAGPQPLLDEQDRFAFVFTLVCCVLIVLALIWLAGRV